MSRQFINDDENKEDLNSEIEAQKLISVTDSKFKIIQTETKNDSILSKVLKFVLEEWPESKNNLAEEIKIYWDNPDCQYKQCPFKK